MAKLPGSPKTGGRQKGTPNKRSSIISEIFDSSGICLPELLLELLPSLSPEKQSDVLLGLMRYVYPAKKAIEHTIPVKPVDLYANLSKKQIEDMIVDTLEILKPGASTYLR